jgi:hypothetical protein
MRLFYQRYPTGQKASDQLSNGNGRRDNEGIGYHKGDKLPVSVMIAEVLVSVVAIEPKPVNQDNSERAWEVCLLIGHQESKYEFVRRSVQIGDRQGWVLNAEPAFSQAFRHNQHISIQNNRQMQQIAKGESVELPFEAGQVLAPEAVQAEMARRWGETSEVV